MSTTIDDPFRSHLAKALDWGEAHVDFDAALKNIPADKRGVVPPGGEYSIWQLLEHMRIAVHDILDFSRNPNYREMKWPDDYWPKSPQPPSAAAWDESFAAFKREREEMKRLVLDLSFDLFARIPYGNGQTVAREALLIVDHNAYHLGQIVLVRRQLGIWPA